MSNRDMLGKNVIRLPMLGQEHDDPIDRIENARQVVDYADPTPPIKAPGSVKIQGVGWWPADRVRPV